MCKLFVWFSLFSLHLLYHKSTEMSSGAILLGLVRRHYIEIIDLMVRENLTQEEVARRMHCSQQNIAKKIEKIRKLLR